MSLEKSPFEPLKKPVFPAAAVVAALKGDGSRRQQRLQSPVNTQFLRLEEPIFPDCKQSDRTKGHFGSSPKVCQYGT
ncbi:hypothetical protein JCGZ_12727 [Jatropha curcas]|uniref:Uncharacterized protein n=1 Tax=Jatropha curcas TaxID=180498 RepID=A0A067KLT3_JATCU|nr:hypothetical protein JCGZ_12727 [Jatropha curcas]